MRTRQPQPSWEHVSSVPASFAISFPFLLWDSADTATVTYTPQGYKDLTEIYPVAIGEGGRLALVHDPDCEPCRC
jgi:hypothetical protein